jgi:hypothetical protein
MDYRTSTSFKYPTAAVAGSTPQAKLRYPTMHASHGNPRAIRGPVDADGRVVQPCQGS